MLSYTGRQATDNRIRCARVVELADSLDSGSSVLYGRAGSSPASRTKRQAKDCLFFVVIGFLFDIMVNREKHGSDDGLENASEYMAFAGGTNEEKLDRQRFGNMHCGGHGRRGGAAGTT